MIWRVWNKTKSEAPMPRTSIDHLCDAEKFDVQLVHWTEDKECRAISITVERDGSTTIEHSTSEPTADDLGMTVESISRVSLNGWEE
jgi:hypothetical protein